MALGDGFIFLKTLLLVVKLLLERVSVPALGDSVHQSLHW